jgi:transglutaminase-like putative cysteine protease
MVKEIILLFCFQCLLTFPALPGEVRYPVSDIPPDLVKNASMVVRKHEIILEVKSLNSEVLKIHHVVTILKGSAAGEAVFRAFYDKYSSVDQLKGSMYDAGGKLIRNFSSKDVFDVCATSDDIQYSDDRVKVIRPVLGNYPVTVEFFSEVTIKRILLYPSFKPQNEYEQSVEFSSLEIIAKEEFFPRFKEVRLPGNTIITGDGKSVKKWEFRDIKPKREEIFSPSLEELVPVIYLNPAIFHIKGYQGNFSTWKSFGMWIKSLNDGRDSLPPDVAQQIRDLVRGNDNPEEKARKLYTHLQKTTRYVAVEFGIGSLQPETAEMVAKLGYGDCKGLVNYMSAMLKCIGIPSWFVLIRAGEDAESIQLDFPGNQFSHVILCVPFGNDTVWLECTSQKSPFGFLGSFTDDRDALLLGPEGGKLVHTPVYGKNVNSIVRNMNIYVDSAGSASVIMKTRYSGLMYEKVNDLLDLSPEKQKEELIERYSIPGLKVVSFSCTSEAEKIPSIYEFLNLKISNFGSVNGNRIFVPTTALLNTTKSYPDDGPRDCDIVLHNCTSLTDSVFIEFPEGYKIESMPSSCEIKSEFGKLSCDLNEENSKILFIRHFETENGKFPPSAFSGFMEFLKKVNRQDNKKLVLVGN